MGTIADAIDRPRQAGRGPDIAVLVGFVALCFAAAGLGGLATSTGAGSWYQQELIKPSWNPPGWVFGPVWTALYTAMAVAAWLVWRTGPPRRAAMTWFGIQLALNAAWSVLFFGLERPDLALVDIALLLAAIAATIATFWRHSRLAAALLVPYLAWVGFATALNGTIVWLNA